MTDTSEQFRHECEARYWLRKGYTSPARIKELTELIRPKRGQAATDRLIDEMRRQWPRRAQWLT
jgi:hypothetical protein